MIKRTLFLQKLAKSMSRCYLRPGVEKPCLACMKNTSDSAAFAKNQVHANLLYTLLTDTLIEPSVVFTYYKNITRKQVECVRYDLNCARSLLFEMDGKKKGEDK